MGPGMVDSEVRRDRAAAIPRADACGVSVLCRVFLIGPVTVIGADGADLTPRSTKSRALLAMLALSPRGARSRVWLRDKLWSDRAEDQASASLRQTLFDIRRSLGPIAKDILVADKHTVTLNLSRTRIDAIELLDPSRPGGVDRQGSDWWGTEHFLEGLDVRDPEFEDWLTLERQIWQSRFDKLDHGGSVDPTSPMRTERYYPTPPASLAGGLSGGRSGNSGNGTPHGQQPGGSDRDGSAGWRVALLPSVMVEQRGEVAVEIPRIQNVVATALLDTGVVRIIDLSHRGPALDADDIDGLGSADVIPIALQIRVRADDTRLNVAIVLLRAADNSLIWTGDSTLDRRDMMTGETNQVQPLINRVTDKVTEFFLRQQASDSTQYEARLVTATSRIFRLSRGDLAHAEKSLRELSVTAPTAQVFAWLAFLISFRIGQRFASDDSHLLEEAQYHAARALELGRDSSLTLALVGHIHSYLFGEYDLAAGLFERCLRANPSQALGWDLYGMLHCYAGQPEKGLALGRWAQHLGETSPHRYYFDVTTCISAALSGRHRAAIAAGQAALRERPDFNSVLRYLVASYAHLGQLEKSETLLQQLTAVEPGFSIQSLVEARYPGLDTAGGLHFIDGLRKAGVRPHG